MEKDKNLQGNKLIEDSIAEMYQHKSDEQLAKVLSIIRTRMMDEGHFVVAVKPGDEGNLEVRLISMPDGTKWFAAFTSMEEEIKRQTDYVSGFTAKISQLFDMALTSEEVEGVLLNPWDKAIRLDKEVIKIIR